MKAKSRRLKADSGLGLIVVDYIQLMRSGSYRESREQEISEISRSLKALAKELRVPVVALSQLNRKVEDRTNRRPQMADLENPALLNRTPTSSLLFTVTKCITNRKKTRKKEIAEIIIAKQRNGPTGTVKLAFVDKYTSFQNLARSEAVPEN